MCNTHCTVCIVQVVYIVQCKCMLTDANEELIKNDHIVEIQS